MMCLRGLRERLGLAVGILAVAAFLVSACSDDNAPSGDASPKEGGADVAAIDAVGNADVPVVDQRVGDQRVVDQSVVDQSVVDQSVVDQSVDILVAGDALAFPLCAKVGGGCTAQRWHVCPAGTEPASSKPHLDCAPGWCCVKAPPSTCGQSGMTNCIEGTKCSGCWGAPADTSLTCPAGRVCCEDICD